MAILEEMTSTIWKSEVWSINIFAVADRKLQTHWRYHSLALGHHIVHTQDLGGGGGYLTNFLRSVIFWSFPHCQNTHYVLTITFIFGRCRCNPAAVTPAKYECDSKNLADTFARSKILLTEKLTNKVLVTPTPVLQRFGPILSVGPVSIKAKELFHEDFANLNKNTFNHNPNYKHCITIYISNTSYAVNLWGKIRWSLYILYI